MCRMNWMTWCQCRNVCPAWHLITVIKWQSWNFFFKKAYLGRFNRNTEDKSRHLALMSTKNIKKASVHPHSKCQQPTAMSAKLSWTDVPLQGNWAKYTIKQQNGLQNTQQGIASSCFYQTVLKVFHFFPSSLMVMDDAGCRVGATQLFLQR